MKKAMVANHFPSNRAIARAIGISPQAVGQWGEIIPERAALKLERITNGDLKYDPSLYGDSHASEPKHDGVAE